MILAYRIELLISFAILLLGCPPPFLNTGYIRYTVIGENCKNRQSDEQRCSFTANGFNVHIDAGSSKRNSLGIAIGLDFFRADCQVTYNWESVSAEVDGFAIHPKACYLDNINLKTNPTVPLSTGRVVTLSINYGKLPFDSPTIAKINLGSVLIGDTTSIDLGSVEVDFTKNIIIPGK